MKYLGLFASILVLSPLALQAQISLTPGVTDKVAIGLDATTSNLHLQGHTWTTLTIDALTNDPQLQFITNGGTDFNAQWTIRMDISNNNLMQWRYNNVRKLNLLTNGDLEVERDLRVTGGIMATQLEVGSAEDTTSLFLGRNAGKNANASNFLSNVFVGTNAGRSHTTGSGNSFFGKDSGYSNNKGLGNSFFGAGAGYSNTTGTDNSVGNRNSFFGVGAGSFIIGSHNIAIGAAAGPPMGFGEVSNKLYIDVIETNTPLIYGEFDNNLVAIHGTLRVTQVGSAGSTDLCWNANEEISTCSSSLRYKDNVFDYMGGSDVLRQLRPVSYLWRSDQSSDLGLIAEEVAEIEPLLVTYNAAGQVEGVKYDRIVVLLTNALREQEDKIKKQEEKLERQEDLISSLQIRIEKLEQKNMQ